MALDLISLGMMKQVLPVHSILFLGYPDVIPAHFEKVFNRPYQENTLTIFDAQHIEVCDVIRHKGFERIIDLNESQAWGDQFDLVVNPGTLEHCFNIGQAWVNAWNAVAVGGYLLNITPATMLNHGFWNVSPITVNDWCLYNCGRVKQMKFAVNGVSSQTIEPTQIPKSKSGRGALPPDTVMYSLCFKKKACEIRWPIQGVYRAR